MVAVDPCFYKKRKKLCHFVGCNILFGFKEVFILRLAFISGSFKHKSFRKFLLTLQL